MEKYKSYASKVLLGAALLLLNACGGGGGSFSNSNSSANSSLVGASSYSAAASSAALKSYSLQKFNTSLVGAIYSVPLMGEDSNSAQYTATFTMENKAVSVVNGVLVTPRDYSLSYTPVAGSMASLSSTTDYIETSTGNLIATLVDGINCTSVSPYHLPASIKVGDAGALSSLSCTNNDTQERSWQTEDAGSGNIRIIFTETTKNSLNSIIKIKYYSYVLEVNGTIAAFKASESFPVKNYNIIFSNSSSSTSSAISSISSSSAKSASSSVKNSTCDGRTYCSQMTSCVEATYFLQHCPGVEMDGNNDGVPCEKQWCH